MGIEFGDFMEVFLSYGENSRKLLDGDIDTLVIPAKLWGTWS